MCIGMTKSIFNYLSYNTKHPSHYVNAHFENGTQSMVLSLLLIMLADTLFMIVSNKWPLTLPKMQADKLFTLHSHSFPECGRECMSLVPDYQDGKCIPKRQCFMKDHIL
jgi:hypothetical protein